MGWNLPSLSVDPRNEVTPLDLPIVECFQKDKAFFISECEHPARFVGSISTWLLDEDVLSSCKCFHRPFVMEANWQLCSKRYRSRIRN